MAAAPSRGRQERSSSSVLILGLQRVSGLYRTEGVFIFTIAAGSAYIYREADGQIGFGPEVVDQWPGQTADSLGKTPSVLLYNQACVDVTDRLSIGADRAPT